MVLTKYGIPAPINLSIALIADLHEENPDDTIDLLKQIQPDIICIAGDTFERHGVGDDPRMKENSTKFQRFVQRTALHLNDLFYRLMGSRRENNPENVYRFIDGVSGIKNRNGEKASVYLSLGNHEWWLDTKDKKALHEAGCVLLDNEFAVGEGFLIGGLSTKVEEKWLEVFSREPGYKILLCHHPEYYDKFLKNRNINLILSGHAHGGQIRVFGQGLFSPGQGLFPKYHHGVYDNRLVVSAGCTNTASIPRWGNPCEVVVVELNRL